MRGDRLIAVPLLVLAAACAKGASGSAGPASGAVLAATVRGHVGLELFSVGKDGVAHLLRELPPPTVGEHAAAWTLSAGGRPDLCVAWRSGSKGELWCYRPSGVGRQVHGGVPGQVSLRPEGDSLAWTQEGASQELLTADYGRAAVKHVHVVDKGKDRSFWPEEEVAGIAWASDHVLVLQRPPTYGRPGGYELMDLLRVPPEGWGQNALSVDPAGTESAAGYDYLTGVRGATIDWVLALEGGRCESGCRHAPPTRAVRAAIGDGRVLEVLGVGATSVSGGEGVVAWTTRVGSSVRVHLRFKGSAPLLVTSLPMGLQSVVVSP